MGKFNVQVDENTYVKASNIITSLGRETVVNSLINNEGPDWLYVAVGAGTTAPGSSDTILYEELSRKPVAGVYSPAPGTARFLGVFTSGEGNGPWNELGIFDSAATRQWLHECDTISGWTSDGTLVSETSIVQQGAASIQCQMTSTGDMPYTTGSLNYGTVSWGTADYLQFWHRTEVDIGVGTVRLGDDSANYYQWTWEPGTVNAWAHFHKTLGEASTAGTPTTALEYFRLTHSAMGTAFNQYLDGISLFQEGGVLVARGTVDATKSFNTVRNVYYSIKIYGVP